MSFNPRPREGATGRLWPRYRYTSCFNPRPREGATVGSDDRRPVLLVVSIRAPVRGRPPAQSGHAPEAVVSIRAPVRGRQRG